MVDDRDKHHIFCRKPKATPQDERHLALFAVAYKAYASAGIEVFRCKRDSKNSLEKRGF